jgi:predicted NUDIX family NTP pyrophosphohydrolase
MDVDARTIHSNTFEIEWPPRSGRSKNFPEVDRAGWFDLTSAYEKITRRKDLSLSGLSYSVPGPESPDGNDKQQQGSATQVPISLSAR